MEDVKNRKFVSGQALKKKYGPYYYVLEIDNFINELSKCSPHEKAKYEMLKNLPTQVEFKELLNSHYSSSVQDLVSTAMSTLEDIGNELQDWYDNLSEGLQATDKADRLSAAADTLLNFSEPDTDCAKDIKVCFLPFLDTSSRPKRLSEAVAMLEECSAAIDDFIASNETNDASAVQPDEELENLHTEIDDIASEAECIDIPGMYN